ncbi:MAG TPA: hypothetical protein VMX79_06510 [bacterium]|nr:hypothetical protein [bacterium]
MRTSIVRSACVALAAVVAFVAAQYAVADYPSIVSSFRMSGTAPPYAQGIVRGGLCGIFFERDDYNYLYTFNTVGSLISTVRLPGAVRLGDADCPPEGYSGFHFAVLDEGAFDVKIYTTAGSYIGTLFAVAPKTVGIGIGGHLAPHIYTVTEEGVVSRFTPYGSFVASYATGVKAADIAAAHGYRYGWGDYIYVGPAQQYDPVRVYDMRSGCSLVGSFNMPGLTNAGGVVAGGTTSYYWNLRRTGVEVWAYKTVVTALMPVEPTSLGKVKALYK